MASDNRITLTSWDSIGALEWGELDGLKPGAGGGLILRHDGAGTREYVDPFGAGAPVAYEYGVWTSPVIEVGYAIGESVTSWQARTPTGTWVEVEFRGRRADGAWTKWFVAGRWTAGNDFAAGDIHRTSVNGQADADGDLSFDAWVAASGREPVAFQSRVTLLRPLGAVTTPALDALHVMTNERLPSSHYRGTSDFTLGRHLELPVPRFSQQTHSGEYPEYGGGGQVWCSPTSTSMVMYFHGEKYQVPDGELIDIEAPAGDPQVDYAAIHSWDHSYDGAGNWPFNTAYAARFGLDGFVTRLRSLAEAERFVDAGIPLVFSAKWEMDDLPEAGYRSDGHLMVLVGFTAEGDPILNDPNHPSNEAVRQVYARENWERVWQTSSYGLTYVMHPPHVKLPANLPEVTTNW